MKTTIFFSFLFLSICSKAQTPEMQIRQMDQHNAETLLSNDTIALKKYLATDFLLNSTNNKMSFGDEPIFTAMRNGFLKHSQFDAVTDTVYFPVKDLAISMGSEKAISSGKGITNPVLVHRRFTNIWVLENKQWKLKARHSSVICNK